MNLHYGVKILLGGILTFLIVVVAFYFARTLDDGIPVTLPLLAIVIVWFILFFDKTKHSGGDGPTGGFGGESDGGGLD